MTFLAVLLVFAWLQWFVPPGLERDYINRWLTIWRPAAGAGLLAAVVLPLLVVFLLDSLLQSILMGVPALLFAVWVLYYTLGRGDFGSHIEQYLAAWEAQDFDRAFQTAASLTGGINERADSEQSLHQKVRQAFCYEGYQRWFAVVFWFVLLGPVGALAYRLCAELTLVQGPALLAQRVLHYLDWLPARLLALCFAVIGNFEHGVKAWRAVAGDNMPVPELLDQCAQAALDGGIAHRHLPEQRQQLIAHGSKDLRFLKSLFSRAALCWLLAILFIQLVLL